MQEREKVLPTLPSLLIDLVYLVAVAGTVNSHGLYCERGGFFIDPWRRWQGYHTRRWRTA